MNDDTTAVLPKKCQYCNGDHPEIQCHRLAAVEYYPNGMISRVEFHEPKPRVTSSISRPGGVPGVFE